jgi:hypothetical protein
VGVLVERGVGRLVCPGITAKALTNPVFYVKMSLIAIAVRLVIVMDRRILRSSVPDAARPSARRSQSRHSSRGPARSRQGDFWRTYTPVCELVT